MNFKTRDYILADFSSTVPNLTIRQIQHLRKTGLIIGECTGKTDALQYTLLDALVCHLVSQLRVKGFSLQKIRPWIVKIRASLKRRVEEPLFREDSITVIIGGGHLCLFISDGFESLVDSPVLEFAHIPSIRQMRKDLLRQVAARRKSYRKGTEPVYNVPAW